MCQCTLCADRFLCGLLSTPGFAEYCRLRDIRLPSRLSARCWEEVLGWWTAVLRGLPDGIRERVEWEQLAVPELATPSGYLHLLAAAGEKGPPPGDASGCLAGALRFLLDQPSVFREVYRRHSHCEPNVWRAARAAAGLALPDPEQAGKRVTDGLGRLARLLAGADGASEVTAHRTPGAIYVSARPGGSAAGVPTLVDFVYFEGHGTVLLRTPRLTASQAHDELIRLGRDALGNPAPALRPGFALDRLKEPFRPLPDGADIVSVRVKTLHLRYPARCGRRELRLHTQTSDSATAVEEMLRVHAGRHLDDLQVSHAVLQFRMRLEGCEKTRLVRLWPDRCDAGQGPFRTRVLAFLRSCGI